MVDLLYKFDPRTGTTRAPMPTDFRHLLGWADKLERFLTIHNQEQLVNVNQQLDNTLNLQVSNIISRVIAQLIGLTDLGWRTIKATPEGALKVALDGLLSDTKNLDSAVISENTAATHELVAATAGQKIHVVNLFFTVEGEQDLTFLSAADPLTGVMPFGAVGEPKGAMIPLGIGPLVCESGEAFNMTLSQAILVSGFCTFYKQIA